MSGAGGPKWKVPNDDKKKTGNQKHLETHRYNNQETHEKTETDD